MKKIIAVLFMVILISTGCSDVKKIEKVEEPINVSRFMTVETTGSWRIVADRETGVMYAVSLGMYNQGNFTLLVDANGDPLIYKEGLD